jgi:hypothetical protein
MADVPLADRAKDRVAHGVHQHIGVGMAFETFAVRNLDAAEDELASRDERVDVVTDANMNHGETISASGI